MPRLATEIETRWMIVKDHPRVAEIEAECFVDCMTGEEIEEVCKQRDIIAMVAVLDGVVAGFLIYQLRSNRYEIVDLAVHPDCQRCGVATALIKRLEAPRTGPSKDKRKRVDVIVSDDALHAHLFFKSMGYRCVQIVREIFCDGSDGYKFTKKIKT
jgi:ribosomal protein S18 acetylase RimI-like enzyme